MGIQALYKIWSNVISSLRGRILVTGGITDDALTLPPTRKQLRKEAVGGQVDPILLMDAHRDADLRLQAKFAQIHDEERNILDKLIVMD